MRIGFIGGSGHHYLKALADDRANQIAIAGDGVDDHATAEFAATIAGAKSFDSAERMLDTFKPDVVSVGAVHAHNGDFAAMSLERNIPTVSDKPVAANWPQYDRLTKLCENNNRKLITEFDFRSRQEFRSAREAVRAGLLGEIVLITGQKSYKWGKRPKWYASREHYPSTLMWIACHAIDAMIFVGAVKLISVIAHQGNVTRPEIGRAEDHAAAMYELGNGGVGVVHADYLRPAKAATHGDDRLRVVGARGVLEVRDNRCLLITETQAEQDITARTPPIAAHDALLAAALGKEQDLYSTQHSLEMARILLKTRDAADCGGRVWLNKKD